MNSGDSELEIVNTYIPPVNSIVGSYHPIIVHLLQEEKIILATGFPNDPRVTLIAD